MADPKKTAKPAPIADVAEPGTSAASSTSKPVIVTNRPIMKDPMVVDEDTEAGKKPTDKLGPNTTGKLKVEPFVETADEPDQAETADKAKTPEKPPVAEVPAVAAEVADAEEAPAEEPAEPSKPDDDSDEADKPDEKTKPNPQADEEAKAAQAAKHDAGIQKLVENKKYFLPINAVEKRRTKRFIVLGIALSLLLALAWADIALDAGLIQIGNIKPVTHFFSN